MKTLVLVDGDQVLDRRVLRGAAIPVCASDHTAHEVVVVFACNTKTITATRVSYEDVENTALVLAKLVATTSERPPPVSITHEIALTLPLPESADLALTSLVRTACSIETSGEFDEVWLFSGDLGIRSVVSSTLSWPWDSLGRFQGIPAWRWRPPVMPRNAGRPLRRGVVLPCAPGGSAPIRNPESPTVIVDSEAAVRAAAATMVQAHGNLARIALLADACPPLLTQIGPTRTSTRGIARLMTLSRAPDTPVAIGNCGDTDGLELNGRSKEQPPVVPEVSFCPLGEGAVRLEWGNPVKTLTVRTNLPAWLLSLHPSWLANACTGVGHQLDGQMVLSHHHGSPDGAPGVQARFHGLGSYGTFGLVCSVDRPGESPPTWWVDENGSTTAKLTLQGPRAGRMLPRDVKGVAAVPWIDAGTLGLSSAVAHGATITVKRETYPGQIGLAETGELRAVILPLRATLPPGARVSCAPVQAFDLDHLATTAKHAGLNIPADLWRGLVRLPLVVPLADAALRGES